MKTRLLCLAVLGLAPCFADAHSGLDAVEHIFGATNINAVTGHGALTVGIAASGDITVLTWPNPSYTDQLGYATSNDWDARDQPRLGAAESAGLFLGLVFELTTGERRVTWLRDEHVWTRTQTYAAAESPNPLTTYSANELHLDVSVEDAVDPELDVFVRDVKIARTVGSPVARAGHSGRSAPRRDRPGTGRRRRRGRPGHAAGRGGWSHPARRGVRMPRGRSALGPRGGSVSHRARAHFPASRAQRNPLFVSGASGLTFRRP